MADDPDSASEADWRSPLLTSIGRRTFLKAAAAAAAAAGLGATIDTTRPDVVRAQVADAAGSAELEAVAESLDYDLEQMFRFVADDIMYEPYAGVLRGPLGTLRGRAGNAADKAVLLAGLLTAAAIPVRFRMGALDDATASTFLSAARGTDAATLSGIAAEVLGTRLAGREGPAATPAPDDPIGQHIAETTAALLERAARQLDEGVHTITGALASAGVPLPEPSSTLADLERTAHAWVQAGVGTTWVDLDATIPGAQPGVVLASPIGGPVAALPDELRHRIELAVIAELLIDGTTLTQVELHRLGAFADELAGASILAFNARPSDLRGVGVSIPDALEGTATYHSILVMGSVAEAADTSMTLGVKGAAGPFGFGGSSKGETTAQWLELRVTSPGVAPAVVRRVVFDRVGADVRAAGTFDPESLAPIELTDLGEGESEFLPAVVVHVMSVAGGAVSGAIFGAASAGGVPEGTVDLSLLPHLAHYVRDGANAALGLPRGVHVLGDGPTVASWAMEPGPQGGDGVTVRSAVDLWYRSLGTLPLLGAAGSPSDAVTAGVLSHVAERILMGNAPRDPGGTYVPPLSVGAIFELAAADGIPTRVLQGADLPAGLPYGRDAQALLGAALGAGLVVIVPERPVLVDGVERLGWWLVVPLTGRTADQLDDGRGVSMPGYARLQTMAARWAPAFIQVGACVARYGEIASKVLTFYSNELGGGLGEAMNYASYVAQAAAESGAGATC